MSFVVSENPPNLVHFSLSREMASKSFNMFSVVIFSEGMKLTSENFYGLQKFFTIPVIPHVKSPNIPVMAADAAHPATIAPPELNVAGPIPNNDACVIAASVIPPDTIAAPYYFCNICWCANLPLDSTLFISPTLVPPFCNFLLCIESINFCVIDSRSLNHVSYSFPTPNK